MHGIEVQNSAQVLEAVNAGEAIGLVDLSSIGDDIGEGRLALACGHVLATGGGCFLAYPEAIRERTSLQRFEQWIFSRARNDW